jgi:hypothetical protein
MMEAVPSVSSPPPAMVPTNPLWGPNVTSTMYLQAVGQPQQAKGVILCEALPQPYSGRMVVVRFLADYPVDYTVKGVALFPGEWHQRRLSGRRCPTPSRSSAPLILWPAMPPGPPYRCGRIPNPAWDVLGRWTCMASKRSYAPSGLTRSSPPANPRYLPENRNQRTGSALPLHDPVFRINPLAH